MLGKPTRTASPLDLIDSEIIQEQASALGRLGRGLEAALAALREFDAALLSPPSDAARSSGQHWSRRPAMPCGCSSSSANPAACATAVPSCATTPCRPRCRSAWACCRRPRRRASGGAAGSGGRLRRRPTVAHLSPRAGRGRIAIAIRVSHVAAGSPQGHVDGRATVSSEINSGEAVRGRGVPSAWCGRSSL